MESSKYSQMKNTRGVVPTPFDCPMVEQCILQIRKSHDQLITQMITHNVITQMITHNVVVVVVVVFLTTNQLHLGYLSSGNGHLAGRYSTL